MRGNPVTQCDDVMRVTLFFGLATPTDPVRVKVMITLSKGESSVFCRQWHRIMFDRAKVASLGAAALGSVALLLCFLVVPVIYSEIEKIRLELRQQANTFKEITDDAEVELLEISGVFGHHTNTRRQAPQFTFDSPTGGFAGANVNPFGQPSNTFGSAQQSAYGPSPQAGYGPQILPAVSASKCECQAKNKCPAGPPGKPGTPGEDGDLGLDGDPGQEGFDAEDLPMVTMKLPCQICPQGPPGLKGDIGPPGPMGPVGEQGMSGPSGKSGKGGSRGIPGAKGPQGQPGRIGAKGAPGKNGISMKGKTGAKGPPGPPGPIGKIGKSGKNGGAGTAGSPGGVGPPGRPGAKGNDGDQGAKGTKGAAGNDAAYCPCPKSGVVGPRRGGKTPSFGPDNPESNFPGPGSQPGLRPSTNAPSFNPDQPESKFPGPGSQPGLRLPTATNTPSFGPDQPESKFPGPGSQPGLRPVAIPPSFDPVLPESPLPPPGEIQLGNLPAAAETPGNIPTSNGGGSAGVISAADVRVIVQRRKS